jgi:hypothetical protein
MTDESDVEADPVAAVVDDIEGRNGVYRHGRPVLIAAVVVSLVASIALGVDALSGVFNRAAANREFLDAIQAERARATLEACRAQNRRHDNTVARVNERYRTLPPVERREAREGRDYTIALVDALAPKRKCKVLVERTVVEGEPD